MPRHRREIPEVPKFHADRVSAIVAGHKLRAAGHTPGNHMPYGYRFLTKWYWTLHRRLLKLKE